MYKLPRQWQSGGLFEQSSFHRKGETHGSGNPRKMQSNPRTQRLWCNGPEITNRAAAENPHKLAYWTVE